jgi:hypothetical protein
MAKPIRQFLQREGTTNESEWRFDPSREGLVQSLEHTKGAVPNNPDNVASFSGIENIYTRRNPYGDAEQDVTPETPALTRANQRAGRRDEDIPNADPRVDEPQVGPGFGFGAASPLNRMTMGQGESYAAPLGAAPAPAVKGRRGMNLGTGKRNAPPPA